MDVVQSMLRWFHVVFGILWIGHLYFFNFVNVPFQGLLDGETKKKVNPELLPRALFWFRYGALWTWITGMLLLGVVFYHGWRGGNKFDATTNVDTTRAVAMILVNLLAFLAYDFLVGQEFAKDLKVLAGIGVLATLIVALLNQSVGGFSFRAMAIHVGSMFGTIMAFNVWFRIWPAQQKIISAVKAGTPPDASLVALAGARSKHNTFLSVPLVWLMLENHNTWAASALGLPGWAWIAIMTALGWWLVTMFYRQSVKVTGF